jgi:hypothetical protein
MHRSTYLSHPVVQSFIEWLSANLDNSTFKHAYLNRLRKTPWQCESLSHAFEQYHWAHPAISRLNVKPGATAHSNHIALMALKADLHNALAPGQAHDGAACQASIDVMVWGGVQAKNVSWLNTHREGLAARLSAVRDALDAGDTDAALLTDASLRFNAGMTKVYSLICRDFVIYDSRVAAALGWAVVMYCRAHQLSKVPVELAFPWAAAKEAGARPAKRRNPGEGALRFPRLKASTNHAQWNLKASWMLTAVLKHPNAALSGFNASTKGDIAALRKLEAALFMIGYDLGPGADGETLPVEPADPEADWNGCFTASHRNPFRYRLTPKGLRVEKGPVFALEMINAMLTDLHQGFGSSPFPLLNSRDDVPNGVSAEGIGTAYYRATGQRGQPIHASKLAAILEDLGVFSLVQGSKRWMLNVDLLTTGANGTLDIKPLIERALNDEEPG